MGEPVYGPAQFMPRDIRAMECYTCGALVLPNTQIQHTNFHLTFSNRIGQDMSTVAWCDYGDHPFKNGEEGSGHFDGSEVVDGRTINKVMDACSKHNPFNVTREASRYAISVEEYKAVNNED